MEERAEEVMAPAPSSSIGGVDDEDVRAIWEELGAAKRELEATTKEKNEELMAMREDLEGAKRLVEATQRELDLAKQVAAAAKQVVASLI